VDGVDDLGAVDALEVDRGDAEVGVSELALDDDQRDALARHLDRVRVAELVRREAPPDASTRRGVAQLLARGVLRPGASAGRSGERAFPPKNDQLRRRHVSLGLAGRQRRSADAAGSRQGRCVLRAPGFSYLPV